MRPDELDEDNRSFPVERHDHTIITTSHLEPDPLAVERFALEVSTPMPSGVCQPAAPAISYQCLKEASVVGCFDQYAIRVLLAIILMLTGLTFPVAGKRQDPHTEKTWGQGLALYELADTQSVINRLCRLIGVAPFDDSHTDDAYNNCVFERRAFQDNGDGTESFAGSTPTNGVPSSLK